MHFIRRTESLFKQRSVLPWKCYYIFLHLSSPNLTGYDHNLLFFDYKVSTQHVCFEKMPRSWDSAHEIHSLPESNISPNFFYKSFLALLSKIHCVFCSLALFLYKPLLFFRLSKNTMNFFILVNSITLSIANFPNYTREIG